MAGKKRTRNGQIKPSDAIQQSTADVPVAEPTPPCGQPQLPSSTQSQNVPQAQHIPKKPTIPEAQPPNAPTPKSHHKNNNPKRKKLPRLPDNTTISKRPLLHPALPTPFSSSTSPKILYLTASSPFIPALKRIRKLLAEIRKRDTQSQAAATKQRWKGKGKTPLEANGRLASGRVERGVVDGIARREEGGKVRGGTGKEGEKVYLKATGRAIPRALELGVQFQGDGEYVVRVEMGSVRAIDDIEVRRKSGGDDTVEGGGGGEDDDDDDDDDIPETRIRTISSVTVSIGLK